VDEIADGHVRVLVAGSQKRQQVEQLRRSLTQAEVIDRAQERSRQLRDVAMSLEQHQEAWSDEVEFYVEQGVLVSFLSQRRRGKPGLPGERPLREGDVFYVEIPAAVQWRPSRELIGISPGLVREVLQGLLESGVEVWDLTAAARQASKVEYHRALEAPAPEDNPSG
jgi:hypothetical protein